MRRRPPRVTSPLNSSLRRNFRARPPTPPLSPRLPLHQRPVWSPTATKQHTTLLPPLSLCARMAQFYSDRVLADGLLAAATLAPTGALLDAGEDDVRDGKMKGGGGDQ